MVILPLKTNGKVHTAEVNIQQTYTFTAFALESTTPSPSTGQAPLSRHQPQTLGFQGLKAPPASSVPSLLPVLFQVTRISLKRSECGSTAVAEALPEGGREVVQRAFEAMIREKATIRGLQFLQSICILNYFLV